VHGDPERKKKRKSERAKAKRETPSAIRVLYHRLLFYKHFIAPSQPVLLGEVAAGRTRWLILHRTIL
jgi:hypothetical protein